MLTAQIGLGFAGREGVDAAGWNVPDGVVAFGLALDVRVLAWAPAEA